MPTSLVNSGSGWRSVVRPVSNVLLNLPEEDAFPRAISECVAWLARRCHGRIPRKAFSGVPFNLDDQASANPTEVVCIDSHDRVVWAASLSYPDSDVAQRSWRTELVLTRAGGSTTLSVRLMNVTRGDDVPFVPSVPGIALQILQKLVVQADGITLLPKPRQLAHDYEIDSLVDLLLSHERQLPIIVSSHNQNGDALVELSSIISRLPGVCHVFDLSEALCWSLTERIGKKWSVFGGALRVYWPTINLLYDNPHRHQLYLPNYMLAEDEIIEDLVNTILPRVLPIIRSERFDVIRAAFVAQHRVVADETVEAWKAQANQLEKENALLSSKIGETDETVNKLLEDAANKQQEAEKDRDYWWDEAGRLRERIFLLEARLRGEQTEQDYPLPSYDEIESWSAKFLSGSIIFLPRAVREIKKSGSLEMITKISDALFLLKNYYVPMRKGEIDLQEFRNACSSLGIDEVPCFKNKDDIKNFPEYRVNYTGGKVFMDRHLRYGQGYDTRRMFRVYFFWDNDNNTVVIGHLPTHLSNWRTN